jgi:hypothetical protein
MLSLTTFSAFAQETETVSPSIVFSSVQKADNSIDLKVAVSAKIETGFVKLYFLKIKFYGLQDTAATELGTIVTDRNGKGVFNVKPDAIKVNKDGTVHFKAVLDAKKNLDGAEEELTFSRARLEITPVKEDSLLTAKVKLIDLATGQEVPVAETTVGIFVKRNFYPLKVGEGTTDAAGEAVIEVPNNLPGDAKGNLTLLAKIDDNEKYGNLEASSVQQWGYAVSDKDQELPRALWSTHPPLWMLITFIVLMTTVWGHYIVIIYELFRLRKEEPHNISTEA